MNRKVFNTVIILIWAVLIGFLVAKIFFGKYVGIAYSSPVLVSAGNYVDSHFWLKRACYFVTTFITYYLYLCSCCQVWKLKWKWVAIITPVLLALQVVKYFEPAIGSALDCVLMFILPYFMGAKFKTTAYIFAAHSLSQIIVGYARNIPINVISPNFMTMLLLGIDMYLWLLLYYFYANRFKGGNKMGEFAPPFWGDNKDHYEKELAKTNKKIDSCKNDKERAKLIAYRDCIVAKLKEFKD